MPRSPGPAAAPPTAPCDASPGGRCATTAPTGAGRCCGASARPWPGSRSAVSPPATRPATSRREWPATPGPATSAGQEPRPFPQGDSQLVPQHEDLGVLPPRLPPPQTQQRHDTGRDEEDQLQAHKPKIIPPPARPAPASPAPDAAGHPPRWHGFRHRGRRHDLAGRARRVRLLPARGWLPAPAPTAPACTAAKTGQWREADLAVAHWLQHTSRDGDMQLHVHSRDRPRRQDEHRREVAGSGFLGLQRAHRRGRRDRLPAPRRSPHRRFGIDWVARDDGHGFEIKGISAEMMRVSSAARPSPPICAPRGAIRAAVRPRAVPAWTRAVA